MKQDGTDVVIDLMVDNGCRELTETNGKNSIVFSQDVSIFKAIDGTIDRGDILDFVDLAGNLGMRVIKKEEMSIIPYAPHRAVMVGREYSTSGMQEIMSMPYIDGKIDIDLGHIYKGVKDAPKEAICHFELWKWNDEREPDKIIV